MKISTKGRYGMRAMLDLAVNYAQSPILLKDVARRQDISLKYLDRICSSLKAAGLLKSSRGSKGGFTLSRPPDEITLKEIVEVLEGPLVLVGCTSDKHYCKRVNTCVTRDIWYELSRAMESVLGSKTLEDLAKRERKKRKASGPMYYI
ncbi:MAG: Rrf2 family transcriptional regulator [Candidatus Omnitrophota bacterium]|jgi:Rrf2 family protein|nr:Rrf2 family transcriptional regulator [Candidatus Omnitrophota bacterium]